MAEPVIPPKQEIPPEVAKLIKLFSDKLSRDGIVSKYANNTAFEQSIWDLKIIFGQLQQRGETEVDWHTAITVPWFQVKLMDYYLRLNLTFYEMEQGRMKIPTAVKPPVPPPLTEEQLRENPRLIELTERYKKIHDEMFGED